ncbi:MAG TPA: histidine kinase dimerization/phospho-acceptor domain-containing protein, partial [Chloroflexota bacterium]|nr:histidine kinase dimerization/phospho-acceptor domain-containing protein [Chloroflexota bacterium]
MPTARARLGLLGTFTILTVAITGALSAALIVGLQWQLEKTALQRAAAAAADQVTGVLDGQLTAEDFAGPLPPARREALEALIGREVLRDRVVRVKMWNADGVVVYSDDAGIVGRPFPIHPYLRAALAGELAYHVSSLEEEEEAHERAAYPRLMEIYVPVRLPDHPGVVGAYEVYHDLGAVQPLIDGMRWLALVTITGGFLVLYGVQFALVRGVSRRLVAQASENARLAREAAQVETLRELDRLKSEFLAVVGHELRTPLASIKGFASALRQDDVPLDVETQRDFLRTIELDTDRLSRLVQDLLDTSRIEAGTLRVEPHPASLAEVVERELALAKHLLRAHEVLVELPADLPLGRFDDRRVGQVLRNLWENAVRHAPAG